MKPSDPILAGIAREHFLIPTLESRRSDSLDFHNVAVWQVEAALQAAFDAGAGFSGKNAERLGVGPAEPVHAMPNPFLVPKGASLALEQAKTPCIYLHFF